jgi:hypothetical protein
MVELAEIIQKLKTNIIAGQEQIPLRKEYRQAITVEIHTVGLQEPLADTLQ